ncbi:MAG TPA: hypothetical protein VIH59_26615 [Candidatus Tectomicrobia bacterium]
MAEDFRSTNPLKTIDVSMLEECIAEAVSRVTSHKFRASISNLEFDQLVGGQITVQLSPRGSLLQASE